MDTFNTWLSNLSNVAKSGAAAYNNISGVTQNSATPPPPGSSGSHATGTLSQYLPWIIGGAALVLAVALLKRK